MIEEKKDAVIVGEQPLDSNMIDLNTLVDDEERKEWHLPFMRYAGSGTHLKARLKRGVKPLNMVDEIALNHDLAYSTIAQDLIQGKITLAEARSSIHEADKRMIAQLREINGYVYGRLSACAVIGCKVVIDKIRSRLGWKNPIYPNLTRLLRVANERRLNIGAEIDADKKLDMQIKIVNNMVQENSNVPSIVPKPKAKRKRKCFLF